MSELGRYLTENEKSQIKDHKMRDWKLKDRMLTPAGVNGAWS